METAPKKPERRLAVVHHYAELIDALRARADKLEVTRATVDELAGTQSGYAAKLLAPVPLRNFGPVSFGPVLQAMGLAIVVIEDLSALKKIDSRISKRLKPRFDARCDADGKKQETARCFPRQ